MLIFKKSKYFFSLVIFYLFFLSSFSFAQSHQHSNHHSNFEGTLSIASNVYLFGIRQEDNRFIPELTLKYLPSSTISIGITANTFNANFSQERINSTHTFLNYQTSINKNNELSTYIGQYRFNGNVNFDNRVFKQIGTSLFIHNTFSLNLDYQETWLVNNSNILSFTASYTYPLSEKYYHDITLRHSSIKNSFSYNYLELGLSHFFSSSFLARVSHLTSNYRHKININNPSHESDFTVRVSYFF